MQLLLLLAALLILAGIVVMLAGLRSAPMGYEDGEGFHVTEPAKTAATFDVPPASRPSRAAAVEDHLDAPGATPTAA